jgi:hypothetical protein
MAERYEGDGAAANGFGRRYLLETEARVLYEAGYMAPPDMCCPGTWWLSAGGIPIPLEPRGSLRCRTDCGDPPPLLRRVHAGAAGGSRQTWNYHDNVHRLWTRV